MFITTPLARSIIFRWASVGKCYSSGEGLAPWTRRSRFSEQKCVLASAKRSRPYVDEVALNVALLAGGKTITSPRASGKVLHNGLPYYLSFQPRSCVNTPLVLVRPRYIMQSLWPSADCLQFGVQDEREIT